MNEAETRAELIDPLLAAAGWGVVEGSRIRREFSITPGRIEGGGRRGKPLTADYVLTYRNTQLAVVEAKPDTAPSAKAWPRPRTTPASCSCASPTPATASASTPSTWPAVRRGRWPPSPALRSSGPAASQARTPGAIASPPSPTPTRAAAGRSASTRTSPCRGCWRPWPPAATASC